MLQLQHQSQHRSSYAVPFLLLLLLLAAHEEGVPHILFSVVLAFLVLIPFFAHA